MTNLHRKSSEEQTSLNAFKVTRFRENKRNKRSNEVTKLATTPDHCTLPLNIFRLNTCLNGNLRLDAIRLNKCDMVTVPMHTHGDSMFRSDGFLRALLNYDYAATKSIIFLQFVKFIHAHPGTAHYVLFNYTEGRVRTEVRVPVFHSTPLVEVPDTFRIESAWMAFGWSLCGWKAPGSVHVTNFDGLHFGCQLVRHGQACGASEEIQDVIGQADPDV
ncbi:hypothetical protein C8J57DRAFT_1226047 [Mycena rebaudengoi]|nr:hypothetical protein C8J57DRAFT_1226047 [Mycena rebaudengoi]